MLDGRKRWIGNASIADVVIVWARDEDGHVGGYLVEKGTPGFDAHGDDRQDRAARRLAGRHRAARTCACRWRAGCPAAATSATSPRCSPHALHGRLARARAWRTAPTRRRWPTRKRREQFGKPIAAYQLVQDKLSRMLAEITAMQLLCLRLSELGAGRPADRRDGVAGEDEPRAPRRARSSADARDILGGNGILLDNHVARHHADMEAIFTFEGTDSIQSLIVGREITGISAIV